MNSRGVRATNAIPRRPVSATGTKLERRHAVEAQALGSVRQLLVELGGSRGLEELAGRGPGAHLERELGLGSLERVELMLRLGDACGVRLPDRVVAEADTVEDLIDAILAQESAPGSAAGVGATLIGNPTGTSTATDFSATTSSGAAAASFARHSPSRSRSAPVRPPTTETAASPRRRVTD